MQGVAKLWFLQFPNRTRGGECILGVLEELSEEEEKRGKQIKIKKKNTQKLEESVVIRRSQCYFLFISKMCLFLSSVYIIMFL